MAVSVGARSVKRHRIWCHIMTAPRRSIRLVPRLGSGSRSDATDDSAKTQSRQYLGPAVVDAIFLTPVGGELMMSVEDVRAEPGGLVGDRYSRRSGYWTGIDECEVTLIEAESLEDIASRYGVAVSGGQHRRNIVTRGVDLRGLAGKEIRIGTALLAYDRPRPPCRYIESLTQPGMTRALGAHRGGICVWVEKAGTIRVGDSITAVSNPSGSRSILRRWF